jgi:hypothetical protein
MRHYLPSPLLQVEQVHQDLTFGYLGGHPAEMRAVGVGEAEDLGQIPVTSRAGVPLRSQARRTGLKRVR